MIRLHEAPKRRKAAAKAPAAAAPPGDEHVRWVLQQYRIVDESGNWTQTDDLEAEAGGKRLGAGPLLEPSVVERFLEADQSKSKKYLDWMLFQAGGGEPAKEMSARELKNIHDMKIEELTDSSGWSDSDGKHHEPVTREKAERFWEQVELPKFEREIMIADQDTLSRFDGEIFGYNRHWPGKDGIYEKIYLAVKNFLKNLVEKTGNQSKISLINQAREKRAKETGTQYAPLKTDITQFKNLEELENANDEFYYFFKRQQAKKDVSFVGKHPETQEYVKGPEEKLYEDDNVIAVIPATIAAMMKVGYQNWCVANPSEFERAFHYDRRQRQNPPWTTYAQQGPFAVFIFKNMADPLKKIAAFFRGNPCRLPDALKPPYSKVEFYDKVNQQNVLTWPGLIDQLKKMGKLETANSLIKAMAEVASWVAQAKEGDVKASPYEALAQKLVHGMLD